MSQRYLIFGATGGIGRHVAHHLAGAGHQLVLSGRNEIALTELAEELNATPLTCDARQWTEVTEVVTTTKKIFGVLDGVVCCIGSILLKPAHLTTEEEFVEIMDTNLSTSFAIVRAATKAMFSGGGSIVLTATAAASIGIANHEAIATAKAGVIGLTRSAAATYAPRKIRVNCIAPGLVETPLSEPLLSNEANRIASERMHPLGRLGHPEEVARAITWMLSPNQNWITGQILGVDGGLSSILSRARS